MIQTKDNGSYHDVTKVFSGGVVQQEIIKIWSTDANDWVYEALGESAGALPLTFRADGSALIDYKIYGNTGGVGVWDGTAQSYKLNMVISDGTNSTTTPIYIGDDPLEKVGDYADYVNYQNQKIVRAIKTYVFDGTEDWRRVRGSESDETKSYFRLEIAPINYLNSSQDASTCSHFNRASVTTTTRTIGYGIYKPSASDYCILNLRPENVSTMTLSDFTTWLAEQYAAGTPVTIWVALTNAEETDPPVPLPEIPTFGNTNTVLDYNGTPAPSSAEINYKKGW